MKFLITLEVEVSREQGKFASRDEIEEKITEAINDANPSTLDTDNEATYTIDSWEITDVSKPK